MKKVYDWNTDVVVKIPKLQKTVILKGLTVHSFIKELQIQICENLILDPLITVMSFYKSGQKEPLKPQSTLYQHRIRNNEAILCDVKSMTNQVISPSVYTQEYQLFGVGELHKYNLAQPQKLSGLVIKGFCSKQGCLDYSKDKSISLGYGVFDFNDILNNKSCQQCGENRFLIKDLSLSYCCWKYSGRYYQFDGTVRSESRNQFERINQQNYSKSIYETILNRRWVELALLIKQL
ncbi:hypothetical protein ABPG72_006075 [Tetrahymena utriculariae]